MEKQAIFVPLSDRYVVRPIYKKAWEDFINILNEAIPIGAKPTTRLVEFQLDQMQFFATPPFLGRNENFPSGDEPIIGFQPVTLTRSEYERLTSIPIFKMFEYTFEQIEDIVNNI